MSLALYYHPLASYCHKVLIALYERHIAFHPQLVDLGNAEHRKQLSTHWPLCKFPVLHDAQRGVSLPESSIIIEYLDHRFPGHPPMIPADREDTLDVRLWDRIFDNYVHTPMQEIVADRLRQTNGDTSPQRALLDAAYRMIDRQVSARTWAASNAFSLADCAAAPALFYANTLEPLPRALPHLCNYFDRLMERPSVRRTIEEAKPYFHLYPFADAIPERFR